MRCKKKNKHCWNFDPVNFRPSTMYINSNSKTKYASLVKKKKIYISNLIC